jgi:pimeloyl-ACP methyl ester carboxylesterase
MTGRLVATNGVELWAELLGTGRLTVLLLGGADASMDRWPASFVSGLLDREYSVLRLEHRDSGRSTKIAAEEPYRLEDMALDVVGVLDDFGFGSARSLDVVGYSMGGAIAQVLALDHPQYVRTLTLIATTPGLGDDRLPFAADWFVERMSERLFAPPPRTFDDRVEWTVDLYRMLAGSRFPFEEDRQRELATVEVTRGWYPESGHGVAANASPSRLDRLHEVMEHALVVHGTEDPVYSVEHAEALADGLPYATLTLVEGLGHEVPEAFGSELARLVADALDPPEGSVPVEPDEI